MSTTKPKQEVYTDLEKPKEKCYTKSELLKIFKNKLPINLKFEELMEALDRLL